MKDVEPLTEINWTVSLSFIPNLQTGSKGGMLQRESYSMWVAEGRVWRWQAAEDPDKKTGRGAGAGTTSESASALASPGGHGPFPAP